MKRSVFKKQIFLSIALVCLISLMQGTEPSIVGAAGEKPVKLGLLTPFSPPGDPAVGKRIKWGADLAVRYINDVMGGVLNKRSVELVAEDDAGTPSEGIAGFRKLVQKDGVVAVTGQYHSSVCLAVNEVAKDLGIPLFATGSSSTKITETQYPTIFSNVLLNPDKARLWIEFAKRMEWKRFAVIAEDTDYGTGTIEACQKYGAENSIEVNGTIIPRTATEMTPALLKVKAWKPDVLLNCLVAPGAYIAVNQAYDIDLFPKTPMIGASDFPVYSEFWRAVGDKGKYILFSSFYKPGMKVTKFGEWVIPRYKQEHNEDITFYGLHVFGQVLIIAQALNLAKSDSPKALLQALTTGTFTTWNGDVKFEETPGMKWHNAPPPMLLVQYTKAGQSLADSKLVWPTSVGGTGKIERP